MEGQAAPKELDITSNQYSITVSSYGALQLLQCKIYPPDFVMEVPNISYL